MNPHHELEPVRLRCLSVHRGDGDFLPVNGGLAWRIRTVRLGIAGSDFREAAAGVAVVMTGLGSIRTAKEDTARVERFSGGRFSTVELANTLPSMGSNKLVMQTANVGTGVSNVGL